MQTKETTAKVVDFFAEKPIALPLVIGGGAVGCAILAGGTLVLSGVVLGTLAGGSALIIIDKLPKSLPYLDIDLKDWALRHQLLIDLIISAGVFLAFGSTATGLVGAGVCGLIVSGGLKLLEAVEEKRGK